MESSTVIQNEQSKVLTFKDGFHPNYQYARAVGLWPFQIIHNTIESNEKTRVRLIDILWFFVSIAVYLTATYYSIDDIKYTEDGSAKSYVVIIYYIFQITALVSGAFSIILDMLNRNLLLKILEKFTTFDHEVGLFCAC